jgi:hypothetical protein
LSSAPAAFELDSVDVLRTTPAPRLHIAQAVLDLAERHNWAWLDRAGRAVINDTFHGLLPRGSGYLMVWRRFNLWGTHWFANALMAQELDSGFAPRGRARLLGFGEDPRLFEYRARPYAYSCLLRRDSSDMQPFLMDIEARRRIPLRIEGDAYMGKNWTPFVHDGSVHFLHTLDPLGCLRCDLDTGLCTWVFHQRPEIVPRMGWGRSAAFGRRRGGTAGLAVGEGRYLGFGHLTHNGSHHQPFGWLLDMTSPSIRFFDVGSPNSTGLADPTSWHRHGSDVRVTATLSETPWDRPTQIECHMARVRGGLAALSAAAGCNLHPD